MILIIYLIGVFLLLSFMVVGSFMAKEKSGIVDYIAMVIISSLSWVAILIMILYAIHVNREVKKRYEKEEVLQQRQD